MVGGERVEGASYRAFLDGLRAVAVYLVVLFHAGVGGFSGGFVGVDVFFVLSGFLVTQLLVRDVVGAGRIRLARFYARRFRRLLPAAFVVLVITALAYSALASPVEVADAQGGFQAAFLYVTNWYFIDQSADYFGADLSTNPVLHFWSLAVEEQFYLAWPLLLGGAYALTRRLGPGRQQRTVRALVVTGMVLSLGWALVLRDTDPARAYYGTDTRAYQLLAGAALALTPGLVTRLGRFVRVAPVAAVAAIAALVLIATSWIDVDPIIRGTLATALTLTLLITLEATNRGPARWALSLPPVVYLGKISYGTYLWHWPVILIMARTFELSTLTTVAYTTLIATALASLSYQLLEHPIRTSTLLNHHRYPVIATGLATSALSALLIIPTITNQPTTTTPTNQPTTTTGFTPVPDNLDPTAIAEDLPPLRGCYQQPAEACTRVEGTGAHILLLGDSHADMMISTFTAIAEARDLTLSVSVEPACPWQRDLHTITVGGIRAQRLEDCDAYRDDLYDRVLTELDPDIVVVMNRAYDGLASFVLADGAGRRQSGFLGPDRRVLRQGSAELERWLDETTSRALADLRGEDRTVVLLESIPYPSDERDILACLSEAAVVEECRYVADLGPGTSEALYRRLDEADDRVTSVDLDGLVCPFLPICDPIIDGRVVKRDGTHLTASFAETLAPALEEFLTANGILSPERAAT